jgi:hypothetical protein
VRLTGKLLIVIEVKTHVSIADDLEPGELIVKASLESFKKAATPSSVGRLDIDWRDLDTCSKLHWMQMTKVFMPVLVAQEMIKPYLDGLFTLS